MTEAKIVSPEQMVEIRAELAEQGQVLVQCHGCFDIVHPGHLRYLQFARRQGDKLLVSVSSDRVVGKGAERPYVPEDLRLENLAALECVDYVVLDDHDWAGPVLETIRPDLYIKGKEYETRSDPRFAREKQLVEGYGGKVVFGSGQVVFSSTAIVKRFSERFQLEAEKIRSYCMRNGIDAPAVESVIDRVADKKLLVIGDAILDRYVHCDAATVAAEGTVLSVSPTAEDWYAGAGALIAAQFAAMGASATFLTTRLDDGPAADRFRGLLERADVDLIEVEADQRPVYVKTRYLVDGRKLLKVDEGNYAPLSTVGTEAMSKAVADLVAAFDGLVAADFGYGLYTKGLIDTIVQVADDTGVPYFADVTQSARANILRFQGAALATPTEQELRAALADTESGLSNLALRFYDETRAQSLMLTLGARGSILFHPPADGERRLRTEYLPAQPAADLDRVGAGDCFLSFAVLSHVAGAPASLAMYLAGAMAALHVSTLGNPAVDLLTARAWLSERPELS